jgi:aryl-alcohol dehydrogenase-like predicted oxidoreductase
MTDLRTLGRSGLAVSALGMGCWAIGGPAWRGENPIGWGQVDDDESIRAIRRALELGVTFFDTANVYGAGHSERVLGKALAGQRQAVVIATKFGNLFDEQTRQVTGHSAEPASIRAQCEASLRRLGSDYLDLYQFHLGGYDLEQASAARDTLEQLVAEGTIRAYGWSTDDPQRAALFAEGEHCATIQQRMNIFEGSAEVLALCEREGLASIIRSPLGMGMLTGKFRPDSALPPDDVRAAQGRQGLFQNGRPNPEFLKRVDAVRDVLTADGRTLAQGALGWLWARSPATIPIPGFKSVAQVEENAGALRFGPLSQTQMQQIDQILKESR